MRRNNNSYRTYFENQEFPEITVNKTAQGHSNDQKGKHYKSANLQFGQQNHSGVLKNSIKQHRYRAYDFQSHQQQNQSKLSNFPHRDSYSTIPYNTEEINKNVNKVLSDIEEIQSEFRKLSSQNSVHVRGGKYENQNHYQSIVVNSNHLSGKFLEELMDQIKKRVNYEQKSDDFISKQKAQLVKLLKNLNQKLNDRLKQVQKDQRRSIARQTIAEAKLSPRRRIKTDYLTESQRKNQSMETLEKSLLQVDEQFNNNHKLIENMRNELDFLNKKYEQYQKSLKNYKSTQHSVDQLHQIIKLKKQQISKLRRKKFLRQKSILSIQKKKGSIFALNSTDILSTNCSTSTHVGDIFSSLKQQYKEYLKKKQKLKSKLQINKMNLNRIQELKEKNNVNKQHYEQLLEELKKARVEGDLGIDEEEHMVNDEEQDKKFGLSRIKKPLTQAQQQHLEFIYKAKRSKLQMLMNTVKRNDHIYKRRYYTLLKQYQAIIDNQNHNNNTNEDVTQSPKVQSNGSYLYKAQQQQIVEGKLDKSRVNIAELENKIQRLGKVGKIVKKVNHVVTRSEYQDQLSQEDNNNNEIYSQQEMGEINDERLIKRNVSNSKSQTTPLVKDRHMLHFNNNDVRNKRVISASTYLKTPQSEVSQKQSSQGYDKDSSFITQNGKSLQDLALALQNSRLNKTNQEKKKYIGKFKKQKIVQKQSRRVNDFVGMSEILLGRKGDNNMNSINSMHMNNDNNTNGTNNTSSNNNNNNKPTADKRKTITLDDIHEPIIQQQIQATNSLSSSQYKPKGPSSPPQTNWDQKILNLIRSGQDIQQEIDSGEDAKQNRKESDNNAQEEQDGFSPQKESEMLLLGGETRRVEKEDSIKQKYQQILFKSKLFS